MAPIAAAVDASLVLERTPLGTISANTPRMQGAKRRHDLTDSDVQLTQSTSRLLRVFLTFCLTNSPISDFEIPTTVEPNAKKGLPNRQPQL